METVTATLDEAKRLHAAGDVKRAEEIYRTLLQQIAPTAELFVLLAVSCRAQGKVDEAIELLRQAIVLQPNHWPALHNLGVCLADKGCPDEACKVLKRAVAAEPRQIESLVDLGQLHKQLGDLEEAAQYFEQAIRVQDSANLRSLLGHVLGQQGQRDESTVQYCEALRMCPFHQPAHSNLLFTLSHDPKVEPAALFTEHRWYDRINGRGTQFKPTFANIPDPERILRVGYVSPDFRQHVAMRFFVPILNAHDASRIETFAYAEVPQPDQQTIALQKKFHAWRPTFRLTDEKVAQLVREDSIDILVDLAGHTGNNRLAVFGYKPAPIQVTYLGYAGTTGMSTIDYRLTDAVADPYGETVYGTEELVRLPGAFFCYEADASLPEVGPLPARDIGTITFGSTHKLVKLNDAVFDLWAKVLHKVTNSRLLIARNTLTRAAAHRITSEFRQRGIAAGRLSLIRLGRDAFAAPYQLMDIFLDVFPWCGHATTCDALWMGIPAVTLCGSSYASRMGASTFSQLGLGEFIATSHEQYVELAVSLASDLNRLARLRSTLRERMRHSVLCDGPRFTRQLEDTYRWMWQRWCVKQRRTEPSTDGQAKVLRSPQTKSTMFGDFNGMCEDSHVVDSHLQNKSRQLAAAEITHG